MKNNIFRTGVLMLGLFSVLMIYLSYLHVYKGPALAANPYNRRLWEYEAQVRRGTIYDTNGIALARTEFSGNKGVRVYPKGAGTAHLVGYVSELYGRTGLESAYDRYLLGMEGGDGIRNFVNKLLGKEQVGSDVILTVDAHLQGMAMDLLGSRRGAVVLLDAGKGAVLVMASSPGYDPNRLEEIWPRLVQDEASPLLNRASQGAYPPGSTLKVVTAAGALAANPGLSGKTFSCPGYLEVDGYKLNDTAVHGEVNLIEAIAVSCNTTFARLGIDLGPEGFARAVKAFGLLQDPGLEIPSRSGTIAPAGKMTPAELASSAIGQGEALVSPLHMGLVAAAIANKGVIMRPYLVEEIRDSVGNIAHSVTQRPWLNATNQAITEVIKEGMVDAVRYGTATAAVVPGMQVAGKTGSAQNPHGETHAWFIGFAPAEQPRLAIAVVLENAGSGGAVAAPVAGRLLATAAARGY